MEEHRTVTEALDALGFGRVQWLLLCYCGLAWLADACETMILSFLGPAIHCAWGVGPGAESLLTSVVFVGMMSGVYSLGVLADAVGRRRGFLASALLLGAAGLASALAPSLPWLLLLRGLVGFGLGGTPIAVTLFAEFCTSAGRGRWLLLMQSFWTIGTMLEALLAWAVLPTLGWRWLLALSALPLLALLVLYPLLPESPHWLVAKGRYAEAEAVLQRVAAANGHRPLPLRLAPGGNGWPNAVASEHQLPTSSGSSGGSLGIVRSRSPSLLGRMQEAPASPGALAPLLGSITASPPRQPLAASSSIQRYQQGEQEQQQAAGGHSGPDGDLRPPAAARTSRRRLQGLLRTMRAAFAAVFSPQLRRTTALLYAIWFVNALTYYGLVLLTTALQTEATEQECTPAGAPNLDSGDYLAILVTTVAEAPGLLAAASLIDTKGRKWTLRAGLGVCAAALCSLVADLPQAGQLALLFVARGCIEGTFSVLYVYTPELYPTSVRSFGLALCNCFSRLGGLSAPFATVFLVEQGRTHTAELLLGGLCGGAVLCAFLLPYETRGRDLQSLQLQPICSSDGSKGQGGSRRQSSDSPDGAPADGSGATGQRSRLHSVGVHPGSDGEAELVPPHAHEEHEASRLLTSCRLT